MDEIPGHGFTSLRKDGYVWYGCECNEGRKWRFDSEEECRAAHARHLEAVRGSEG